MCCSTSPVVLGQGEKEIKVNRRITELGDELLHRSSLDSQLIAVGDPYLTGAWNAGTITLYRNSATYAAPKFKYDVFNNGVDILLEDNSIRSLRGDVIQSFLYSDSLTHAPHRFINAKGFTLEGHPLSGFLEVLCWGKVDVYAFVEVANLKPARETGVRTGNRMYEITKSRVLVYSPGTELRQLDRRELSRIWSEREAEMMRFQKVNKLDPSREGDLMLMIDYFNTL
jgi:hypothetical protein